MCCCGSSRILVISPRYPALSSETLKEASSSISRSRPFSAIFSLFKPGKKEEKKDKEESDKEKYEKLKKEVNKSENYAEKYLRNFALADAANKSFTVYDIYKKSHGMAAFPYTEEKEVKAPVSKAERLFGFKK